MAKQKQTETSETDGSTRSGGRSFKPDTGKFNTLKANESVTGFFMGAKMQTITDRRTRQPKELFVLKLREETEEEIGPVRKVPCAAMLLQAWEDVVDEYGNGDQEIAINTLRGKKMTINRGDDTRTKEDNQMGTYEIIVFE